MIRPGSLKTQRMERRCGVASIRTTKWLDAYRRMLQMMFVAGSRSIRSADWRCGGPSGSREQHVKVPLCITSAWSKPFPDIDVELDGTTRSSCVFGGKPCRQTNCTRKNGTDFLQAVPGVLGQSARFRQSPLWRFRPGLSRHYHIRTGYHRNRHRRASPSIALMPCPEI